MRLAVHLFDDAEELDWAGPWEMLGVWKMLCDQDPEGRDLELLTVARDREVVTCAKGLRVLADRTWETLGPIDLLVYPGGRGTRPQIGDTAIHGWLRGLHRAETTMASVCTGALLFADAGLLDGRAATTHWRALDLLGELGTDVEVRPDDRFVDHGDVATAAGVSAGIDLALALIARLDSVDRAKQVRRYAQYDPEPPV